MNKNLVIGILAIILVLSFLWGQMGNRSEKGAKQKLETAVAQLAQTETETAKLQKTVQVSGEQLTKAQNDLKKLRKAGKALEAKISNNDAVVAALTREKDTLAGQIDKMKNAPVVATGNNQQQIDALQSRMVDLEAALQTREQQLAAAKEIAEESRAKIEKYSSGMWIKSEIAPAEPGALNREELQAKLAKVESSLRDMQHKFATAETAVEIQKHHLVAATEELAETRAKVKGDYSSRVWIKSELTPVEQETQEKEKLQTEISEMASSVQELQEKLAVAEQGAQRAKELLVKLSKSESSFKGLQEKRTQAESTIQELKGKLEESALSIRDLGEKVAALDQAKLTRKYEALRAQVMGFELMVEDKDAVLEEMNKKLDHWNINKDLLLATISEQQERLQKLQDANQGLLRDLAAKKKELAEEKKKISATP